MKELFTSYPMTKKWAISLVCVIAVALVVPAASSACPTCSGRPAAVWGWQPHRSTLGSTFNNAATDSLANAPDYDQIWRGVCPACYKVSVSTSEPIPSVILKALGWQESSWRQFDCDYPEVIDDAWDYTLISDDCGYGIMQMTSCMYDGCGWFTPDSVARYIDYNIGTGTNFLIREKWNKLDFYIGSNNHTYPEDWYYAVIAYGPGGWSNSNNPNNGDFDPQRAPFDGSQYPEDYPYQEVIWGHASHPQTVGSQLWTPVRIPWVPRGIFGPDSPSDWEPARETPRPTFYYLPDIKVNYNGWNSYIVIQNPHSDLTLAVDIALYNQDGTFNRWRLDPPIDDPPPYIRLAPHASRTLSVADAFHWWESFNGSAVISASEDVAVMVKQQGYDKTFAYSGLRDSSVFGFSPGTTIYLPISLDAYYGWYSHATVQNAGNNPDTVTATYYNSSGQGIYSEAKDIDPGASAEFDSPAGIQTSAMKLYTSNNEPIVATATQYDAPYIDESDRTSSYIGFSAGGYDVYLPGLYKNYYGWTSAFRIQNLSSSTAWVTIKYYDENGGNPFTESATIEPHGWREFYQGDDPGPSSFSRSAWVDSTQPIVAVVNQETSSDHQSYSGFISGARTIYLPLVQRNINGWVTGIQVQNTSENWAYVTINFYHANGDSAGSTGAWIAPRAFRVFYTEIPDGLNGSAVVTADQDVVAIVNQNNYGISDGALSYSGLD